MKTVFRGNAKVGTVTQSPPFKACVTQKFTYDFTRDGGAISAIALKDELGRVAKIPNNAVVVGVRQESIIDLTSAGAATVALGYTGAATAFVGATALTDASFDVDAVTARTANFKMTATSDCLATIATAALTAGKFNLYVDYYEGD